MRLLILIATYMMAACLFSCRSKQTFTIESDSTTVMVDSTRIISDTFINHHSEIDTSKNTERSEYGHILEFVEQGGKVTINSAGNITIDGIRNITDNYKSDIFLNKGISSRKDSIEIYNVRQNSLSANRTNHIKSENITIPATSWYDKAFTHIGQLCCSVLLMYLIFLYIRRKK